MILYSGYYGFDNFGDDLFPLACKKISIELAGNNKFRILSPRVSGVEEYCLLPSWISAAYKSRQYGGLIRLAALLLYSPRIKHLIVAGGSTISSHSSKRMRKFEYLCCRLNLFKISCIGVSIGPFDKRDYFFYRKYISSLTTALVRDRKSIARSKEIGVEKSLRQSVDLVGILRPEIRQTSKHFCAEGGARVGVSICRYEAFRGNGVELDNSRFDALKNALVEIAKGKAIEIIIISLNSDSVIGDDKISDMFSKELELAGLVSSVEYYRDPWESISLIKSLDFFFTFRLHGAIVAYLAEIPFTLIEYHEKCRDFLEDVGCPDSRRVKSPESVSDYVSVYNCAINSIGQEFSLSPIAYEEKARIDFHDFFASKE